MLSAFLDRYRETMVWKLDGLSTEQASRRLVPSASTLLGVVKHLAYVEIGWFRNLSATEPASLICTFLAGHDDHELSRMLPNR